MLGGTFSSDLDTALSAGGLGGAVAEDSRNGRGLSVGGIGTIGQNPALKRVAKRAVASCLKDDETARYRVRCHAGRVVVTGSPARAVRCIKAAFDRAVERGTLAGGFTFKINKLTD